MFIVKLKFVLHIYSKLTSLMMLMENYTCSSIGMMVGWLNW